MNKKPYRENVMSIREAKRMATLPGLRCRVSWLTGSDFWPSVNLNKGSFSFNLSSLQADTIFRGYQSKALWVRGDRPTATVIARPGAIGHVRTIGVGLLFCRRIGSWTVSIFRIFNLGRGALCNEASLWSTKSMVKVFDQSQDE